MITHGSNWRIPADIHEMDLVGCWEMILFLASIHPTYQRYFHGLQCWYTHYKYSCYVNAIAI